MLLLSAAGLGCLTVCAPVAKRDVVALCQEYRRAFGSEATSVCYHHRLDGPRGIGVLEAPAEIAAGRVRGKEMPYGYGSGIQDVALENGHFLFALCEAYDATRDEAIAELARWVFQGFRKVATVSPEPGFVPRGPHPDGVSYYRDSSRDQHAAFSEALWRWSRSPLATDDDRLFAAEHVAAVADRMNRNGWFIKVEDNSDVAHVGFCWLQRTSVGATSLLSVLAEASDATRDQRWQDLYQRYSTEGDGYRWTELLSSAAVEHWPPLTLYANQFAVGLVALSRCETDPVRQAALHEMLTALARRSLDSNVWDETLWRRLDWAGSKSPAEVSQLLAKVGLSLDQPMTVKDLWAHFKPEYLTAKDAQVRGLAGKLLFGLPTVAAHFALLAEDPALTAEVAPLVDGMVQCLLDHGQSYHGGEDFNRTVVLGLTLLARQAGR